jgi:hypothetical protein
MSAGEEAARRSRALTPFDTTVKPDKVKHEAEEREAPRREATLQEVEFVGGGVTLRLLADPENAWGRSAEGAVQHCNTGNRLWPAAATLADFLCDSLLAAAGSDATGKGAEAPRPLPDVIELGAGLGAVGLALAKKGCRVVLTDQPQMLPLLRRNVEAQFGGAVGWAHCAPEVRALPWGECSEGAAAALGGLPQKYPLVIGSDLCYDDDAFAALRRTLEAVAAPGAVVALAVHERPAAATFFLAPSRFQWTMARCVECAPDPVSGKSTILVYTGRSEEEEGDSEERGEGGGGTGAVVAFALGDVVEAHSLKTAALNGKQGVVVTTRGMEPGRVGVSFPPPLGRKSIRSTNLHRAATAGLAS